MRFFYSVPVRSGHGDDRADLQGQQERLALLLRESGIKATTGIICREDRKALAVRTYDELNKNRVIRLLQNPEAPERVEFEQTPVDVEIIGAIRKN